MKAEQERKSVINEALDLKSALMEVLSMAKEPQPSKEGSLAVPSSSLKLDNLRNTLLDCKEIANQIAMSLRLLA